MVGVSAWYFELIAFNQNRRVDDSGGYAGKKAAKSLVDLVGIA
jgi:hypothetical protein